VPLLHQRFSSGQTRLLVKRSQRPCNHGVDVVRNVYGCRNITSRSDTSFTFLVRLAYEKKNRRCYNLNTLVLKGSAYIHRSLTKSWQLFFLKGNVLLYKNFIIYTWKYIMYFTNNAFYLSYPGSIIDPG
ncbi:hypothetical protein C0J52_22458, partial [Blattella germanica]